ncbi:hypothetical protein AB0K60_21895 [Thermopolyspora sp. NPDC052614]|uniref:hypothetical protein n=1 Tax=Thermopolyspora sp. NPDC052614 TaxID=3155682 RepID=UPI0034154577
MSDRRARLRYLEQVLAALFPPPARARHQYTRQYALLPHRLLPRRLVPRAPHHRLLGGAVSVPVGDDSIEGYLSRALDRDVRVVVRVRPARRANRKPVLEVHDATGLIAFAKIADTPRVRDLVRHEAATLRLLAETPTEVVVPPRVLHHGVWRGMDVLVLTALPVPRPRRGPAPALLAAAIDEISTLATRADRVGSRANAWGDGGEWSAWSWHGDFSPWNIAPGPGGRLLVWDWERFGTGVPLGFDALHHCFHRTLRRAPASRAAEVCLARAPRMLAPFGVPADRARETAARYLVALADRHRRDGHEPLGPPARWLTPLLEVPC